MKFIDLSLTIAPNNSEPVAVRIDYVNHIDGALMLGESAGLTEKDFPDNIGLSIEYINLTSHTGTHIDAPAHYGPTCEGRQSKFVEDLPLEWFFSDGVVLRFDESPDLGDISLSEIQQQLQIINYRIKPLDIVLLQSGGDKSWGTPKYFTDFRGVSEEATSWLIDQGVKVIGVDTFGFDPPFGIMLERYRKTNEKKYLWPAHILGRTKEYCQIERLTNLSLIPFSYGFKVMCFPIKLKFAGAGWSRVIAQIE